MHNTIIFSFLITCATICRGHENDVHTVQYNTDNFSEEVAKKNHFVMFYAPWCGHCQRLAPTWEQLAEMLNEDDSNTRIAKVDCTTDSKICTENDVTGYPTLKFFKVGDSESVKFRGTRDLPSLTSFINEQLGSESADNVVKVPESQNHLVELTEHTFEKHVATGRHFVKFYAPWCGHCQKLAPVWKQLADSLEFEDGITIAKIDCTQHRVICNQFDIKGYPTLLWIEDGKKVDKYQGPRGHEDLKKYVSNMLGTSDEEMKEDEEKKKEGDTQEEEPSPIMILNGDSFEHGIANGVALIKFFAPWCGHCKRLAPTWEELGKKFAHNSNINIVKVDCTLEENKQLCSDQKVDGFPSVFLYKNGEKISEYVGNRSLDDLIGFVLKHTEEDGHDEL